MQWSAQIHTKFHVHRVTQEFPRGSSVFDYGAVTLFGAIFHSLHLTSKLPRRAPTTPGCKQPGLACSAFARHYLRNLFRFLFLRLLRCFTSPGLACPLLFDSERNAWICPGRLPHSEIHGSKRVCRSPWLIAAYHVLLRLLAPRHSSCALE